MACSTLNYSPIDQKYTYKVDGTYVFDDNYESSHQLHQLAFPDENRLRGLFNVTDQNNKNNYTNFMYSVFSTGMKNIKIILIVFNCLLLIPYKTIQFTQ